MNYKNAACVEDLAEIARRRVPAFAFDYLDSGAGNDVGVRWNRAAFEIIERKMVPLAGVMKPETRNHFVRSDVVIADRRLTDGHGEWRLASD